MTPSKPPAALEAEADAFSSSLLATDPRFRRRVELRHEDGTELNIEYAFVHNHGQWVWIISEHHRPLVYRRDDLKNLREHEF